MIVLSFVSIFLACGDKSDDTSADSGDGCMFEDRDLVFQSAEGFELVGDGLSIDFTQNACQMNFNAGCNTLGGEYEVVNGVFEMSETYSTYMDCETPLMDQDAWLAEFFTSGPDVVHDGDTMTFTGADATLVFVEE